MKRRNSEILRLSRSGTGHADIAARFGLTRTAVDHVVRKAMVGYEQEARNILFLEQLRQSDDMGKSWPVSPLLAALVPRTMTRKALLRYWEDNETICLRDFMEVVISHDQDPRPGFLVSPLLDVRCAGIKGFWAVVDHISVLDLGPECNAAWRNRLSRLESAERIKGARRGSWSQPIRHGRPPSSTRNRPRSTTALVGQGTGADVSFSTCCFSECVQLHPELVALRATSARKTPEERRMAADWEYHSAIASRLFNEAARKSGDSGTAPARWPEGVLALAIDPTYAPAILTVGTIEYQLGRRNEAMQLLLSLTGLPADEPDLATIIDKAGEFLIEEEDYERARDLYAAAEKAFPDTAVYPAGHGYCLGQLGQHEDAIREAERVNELEPENHEHLNDLGWALYQAGHPGRARAVLEEAVALAPRGYEVAWNNLEIVCDALRKADQ